MNWPLRGAAAMGLAALSSLVVLSCMSTGGPTQLGEVNNDQCLVCHFAGFADEPLAVAHQRARVLCVSCHGRSKGHTDDENIGATKPDVMLKKAEIDAFCRKCHPAHVKLPDATREARLAAGHKQQVEIKGHAVEAAGVCTDCHGSHWIKHKNE
jgi:predicted CXXCH cytochrome family protein